MILNRICIDAESLQGFLICADLITFAPIILKDAHVWNPMPSLKKLIAGFIEINLTFTLFLLILALLTFILQFFGIDLWKILIGILLSLGILSLVSGFVASFLTWVTHSIGWILATLHLNFLIITPLLFVKKNICIYHLLLGEEFQESARLSG
jgi:hypothetical protein